MRPKKITSIIQVKQQQQKVFFKVGNRSAAVSLLDIFLSFLPHLKRLLFKKSVGDKLRQDKLPPVYLVHFPNCYFRRRQTGFHTKKENSNQWQKSQKKPSKKVFQICRLASFCEKTGRLIFFFSHWNSVQKPASPFFPLSFWQRWAGPAARKENPWKINSSEFVIVQKGPSYCPSVSTFFSFRFHFFLLLEPRLSSFTFWDENADFYFFCAGFSPIFRGAKVSGAVCNLIISP